MEIFERLFRGVLKISTLATPGPGMIETFFAAQERRDLKHTLAWLAVVGLLEAGRTWLVVEAINATSSLTTDLLTSPQFLVQVGVGAAILGISYLLETEPQ